MKKLLMLSGMIVFAIQIAMAQNTNYQPVSSFNGDTIAYYQHNFIKNKNYYIDKSVTVLLNDLEVPIMSYSMIYTTDPNYVNMFTFSNRDNDIKGTILERNTNPFDYGKLYLLKIKFEPGIPYSTISEFLWDSRESGLSPNQYGEFSQYTITDIIFTYYPRP